jgi:hypothetical protein
MATQDNGGHYEVVWPRGQRQLQTQPLAKRLDTLNGKTIAELWDFLFRGDDIFTMLQHDLKERYPDVQFVSWKEFGSTHGAAERDILASFPERFKELGVDAVISGMGC